MQTFAPAPSTFTASDRARRNQRANLCALRQVGGSIGIFDFTPSGDDGGPGEYVSGRDGYLTHRAAAGWAAGCSLPRRAAEQQLRTIDVPGPVACFLDPPHAAHLRVALDKLKPSQAVVAVVLYAGDLPVLLSCDDFSADVAAHRLWVVAGEAWATALRELFDAHPGLPRPTQFVRLTLPDADRLDPVIAEAQRVFADVTADRAKRASTVSGGWRPAAVPAARLCVVAGRQFRLGDDAGPALAAAVEATGDRTRFRGLDADDPLTASGLAMLLAAADCGALLTADVGRAGAPDLLPPQLPWATWVTTPHVPAFAAAGPNDRLLLAEPDWRVAAAAAGWPPDRVDVAGWPVLVHDHCNDRASDRPEGPAVARERRRRKGLSGEHQPPSAPPLPDARGSSNASPEIFRERALADSPAVRSPTAEPHVGIVCDTVPLDPPDRLEDYSSHRLLWNALRQELHDDPGATGSDPDAYLRARQRRFDVDDASFDRKLFMYGLIWPAVAQGVARRLIGARVPVRIHGRGWASLPAFAGHAAGPVASRRQLSEVTAATAGVLDVRPAAWRNGLWSAGRPVIRCGGRPFPAIRHDVSLALSGRGRPDPVVPPINLAALLDRLGRRA